MQRREIARFHTVVHTRVATPGYRDRRIFVLYVLDDAGKPAALMPLVEYVLEHGRRRSLAWQREVTRSTGLFIDFLRAHADALRAEKHRPQILAAFAEALVTGTIDPEGGDQSELFWTPKNLGRATAILNSLTVFADWLVDRYQATALNPWRTASPGEQIAYWRRFEKYRPHSLLMHTQGVERATANAERMRAVGVARKAISADLAPVKYFPRDRIWDLLESGFAVAANRALPSMYERMNIRDAMITVLMHGGGLRESEPFHLYVTDVAVDPHNPKCALVRLFHPEQGIAPADFIDPLAKNLVLADREQYLRVKWQMEPRNLAPGRFHAGWKDLHLTDERLKYALVHWFPSYWGEVFLVLFKLYITKVRSRHSHHPFLFVSQKDGVAGDPYTVASFRQAHAKAVLRIGLPVGKEFGTTPHGHRHTYGQLLTEAKLDPLVIQRCLHHKARESQQVYTEPTPAAITKALNEAAQRLEDHRVKTMFGQGDGI
ncbi:gamma-mobile-trio recombinase GmtY [Pseudoduganella buxea]|nr:gamma-mobile-trio recombinase GmtY [Pseudoduganella buxea]GGC23896.1 integrase [Pseudoduganella buxea]